MITESQGKRKILFCNRGQSLISVGVIIVALHAVIYSAYRLYSRSSSLNESHNLRQERALVAKTVFGRLDCSRTLAQIPITDADCTNDLYNQIAPYLSIRDSNNNVVTENYDGGTGIGTLGGLSVRASCFLKTEFPSGTVKRCVLVHAAIPAEGNDFKKDPFTKQNLSWMPLVPFAQCCDLGGPPPPPPPPGPAGPGPGPGTGPASSTSSGPGPGTGPASSTSSGTGPGPGSTSGPSSGSVVSSGPGSGTGPGPGSGPGSSSAAGPSAGPGPGSTCVWQGTGCAWTCSGGSVVITDGSGCVDSCTGTNHGCGTPGYCCSGGGHTQHCGINIGDPDPQHDCGSHCCDIGKLCCGSGCCPGDAPAWKCCGSHCCEQNETCCGGGCCPPGKKCCGTYCCPDAEVCDPNGPGCCTP